MYQLVNKTNQRIETIENNNEFTYYFTLIKYIQ